MVTAARTILIATDADEVFDEVDAALGEPGTTIARVSAGREVLGAVKELEPDLVVLDLQIGNMGGVATCLGLRNEESFDRISPQNVIILLDRDADVFIARRADADGWLVKPIDSLRLRAAAAAVLAGERFIDATHTDGSPTFVPEPEPEPEATADDSDAAPDDAATEDVAS